MKITFRHMACALALFSMPASAEDWPQWMGAKRDGFWREDIPAKPAAGSWKVRWRVPGGSGYAGPAVLGNKVYCADRLRDGEKPVEGSLPGRERLRCLEAATGKLVWERTWEVPYQIDYGSGPRATPTVQDGKVWFLGAQGDLRCLQAASGDVVWEKSLTQTYQCKPPTWGYAAHPLIWEGRLLTLAGGKESAVVALNPETGAEQWRALTASQVGYCAPLVTPHHGRKDAIVWTAEAIHGINATNGQELWSIPWSIRFGVAIAQPVQKGDSVLVSNYWAGCKMLQLQADGSLPKILWETERESEKNTTHLNALMAGPLVVGDSVYGTCSFGHLRCLEWKTGNRRWSTLESLKGEEIRWGTTFLTRVGTQPNTNQFLLFNEFGELISATLTEAGWQPHARQQILEPNCIDLKDRKLVWSHPAYAAGACYARNDTEIVCVELR